MAEERDPADVSADKYEGKARQRREVGSQASKFHELPGGKNNPIHKQVPGMDAANPQHQQMAKHSADFILHASRGDRGKAEAARAAFHSVKAVAGKTPKGVEAPCPSGGCGRALSENTTCASTGGCRPIGGAQMKVGRPRG